MKQEVRFVVDERRVVRMFECRMRCGLNAMNSLDWNGLAEIT